MAPGSADGSHPETRCRSLCQRGRELAGRVAPELTGIRAGFSGERNGRKAGERRRRSSDTLPTTGAAARTTAGRRAAERRSASSSRRGRDICLFAGVSDPGNWMKSRAGLTWPGKPTTNRRRLRDTPGFAGGSTVDDLAAEAGKTDRTPSPAKSLHGFSEQRNGIEEELSSGEQTIGREDRRAQPHGRKLPGGRCGRKGPVLSGEVGAGSNVMPT